ncbi:MAG: Gfo/Idh/MocA family oxidoreductase, partial [Saprospiraceae bacterium]|nr:Gfo/Idh/MocA family oxidoreductase [Saprospiraceae bacterium]
MKQSKNTSSRRDFVKKMAAGAALLSASGPTILSGKNEVQQFGLSRQNPYSANDQIQIALIGAGGMGTEDTKTALLVPGVKLVAVCDLYSGRLEDAKGRWGKDLFTTKDYREILERSDVDAVIVATPDHWHMPISVDALGKGKG